MKEPFITIYKAICYDLDGTKHILKGTDYDKLMNEIDWYGLDVEDVLEDKIQTLEVEI